MGFGNWNAVFTNFGRRAKDGTRSDWVAFIDSTIVSVHQHGATLPRTRGPRGITSTADHAIGLSRGGLASKRGFNGLKNWRSSAIRSDKQLRSRRSAGCLTRLAQKPAMATLPRAARAGQAVTPRPVSIDTVRAVEVVATIQ